MTYSIGKLIPMSQLILAQEASDTGTEQITGVPFIDSLVASIGENLGTSILNLIFGILVLIVGWIIAGIVRSVVRNLLGKTNVDNKIAAWIFGQETGDDLNIEKWIADLVYWIIILFVVVAVLQTIQLDVVSEPLNSLLEQVTSFLPKIGAAAILLGLAWLLATLVKLLVSRSLQAINLDQRLGQQMGEETEGEGEEAAQFSLTETIGKTLYWFIFLLFLPSILSTLQLEGTLEPVQSLVDEVLAILPNVFSAILIGAVGWAIAQIIRKVVTNLLSATGTDRLGSRFGVSTATGGKSLSWIVGTVVYVLVLIPVAITALDALQIRAISEPAIGMLDQILAVLPRIFTAAVILMFAYVAGQYICELVTNILTSVGFDSVGEWLGLPTSSPSSETSDTPSPEGGEPTVLQSGGPVGRKTPSELVGIILLVGIMLVATLTAVDVLQIPALTDLVEAIVFISGKVLTGLLVFAIGLFLANLVFRLITSSGSRQSQILAQTARIAIIALVSAMALQQMGIASNIVNLAFGLLLGAIAVAIALAFGLGGRDIAARQVQEWLDSFKRD